MDLLHAADYGRFTLVKQLVSKDKSLLNKCRHTNSRNHAFNLDGSAIHYACRSGHLNIVKYLLQQDSSLIHQLDRERWTPLHYACYNGHINIVKLLLEYHPDVNLRDTFLSQTPIEFAMYRQFEDIVYLLDPHINWTRRSAKEIETKGNVSVFRKKSDLFLGRYILNANDIEKIELFRSNPQANHIELNNIQDAELNNMKVGIRLTHDFKEHMAKTIELSSKEDDDLFLRSSTTSTNEHVMIFNNE